MQEVWQKRYGEEENKTEHEKLEGGEKKNIINKKEKRKKVEKKKNINN